MTAAARRARVACGQTRNAKQGLRTKVRETRDTTRRPVESFIAAVTKSFRLQSKQPPRDSKKRITMPRHAHDTLDARAFGE